MDSYRLKLAAPHIMDILLHLVNTSLSSGTFGSIWKTQLIYPFHKKGDRSETSNYRPVSHISEVSKLVEYAVFDQLMDHFVNNNLFHSNHHGFVPKHNTVTALAQLYDIWLEASENKEMSAALLLDLSAAFDLIPHSILLKKMKLYNFDDTTMQFFKSYLEDRRQVVQIESKRSEPKEIGDVSVPQGSILGGIIFVIYQNDFPENHPEGDEESILYADDDTDVAHDADLKTLEEKIQIKADASVSWIRDNQMVCSGEKTKVLVIGTREMRTRKYEEFGRKLRVKVEDKVVEESTDERLLGIVIN